MERRWRSRAGMGSIAVDMTAFTPERSDEGLGVTISRGTPASWHCLPPSLAAQTSESGRRGAGLAIVSIPPPKPRSIAALLPRKIRTGVLSRSLM